MIDKDRILDSMECYAEKVLESISTYPKQGIFVVQLRDSQIFDQWNSSIRFFGKHERAPKILENREVDNGCSFDATVHGKIAYSRRTGINSGASIYDLCGDESYYRGAVVSSDQNCICAFSGFSENDDHAIAQEGLKEYERQSNNE